MSPYVSFSICVIKSTSFNFSCDKFYMKTYLFFIHLKQKNYIAEL